MNRRPSKERTCSEPRRAREFVAAILKLTIVNKCRKVRGHLYSGGKEACLTGLLQTQEDPALKIELA
jgi:hypothetical protein